MGGGSSKSSSTTGYQYYIGVHMVLCHGPIDGISRIIVDGTKTAWSGFSSGGKLTINKPGLFGGDDREGGIRGDVDIALGEPTQGRNSYLRARLGDDIPAYRGVVSAILRQVYIGLHPYVKPWSFVARRVFTRTSEGIPQWYSATAGIVHGVPSQRVFHEDWLSGLTNWTLIQGTIDTYQIIDGSLHILGTQAGPNDSIGEVFRSGVRLVSGATRLPLG